MIEIKNITKYYGKGESRFKALDDVSMNIKDGEFLVILGASGSGKSTFLNVISGLETLDDGEVIYNEEHLEKMNEKELTKFRRDNVAFIFQQYYLLPHLNVEKNVKTKTAATTVPPLNQPKRARKSSTKRFPAEPCAKT